MTGKGKKIRSIRKNVTRMPLCLYLQSKFQTFKINQMWLIYFQSGNNLNLFKRYFNFQETCIQER